MKLFKIILSGIALLTMGSVNAKRMGSMEGKITPTEEVMPPMEAEMPVEGPEVPFVQPDISKLPAPMDAPTPEVTLEKQREEKRGMERRAKETRARGEKKREGARPMRQPQGPKLSMEDYARNKVSTFSKKVVDDVFPKQNTIERIVFEFKDEFPGPNKESDTTILYNAIINNPEIKKSITLKNAVSVYNFIKEAISNAWDKKDNIIWSR